MLAPTAGSRASPRSAWACCLNCRAGSTRHSHGGAGVLEKPQPTAFPNQLWAVELLGVLPSPGVGAAAVGWGCRPQVAESGHLLGGRSIQTSPSSKAPLTLPTALSAVFSPRGGSQAPSRHIPPWPSCLWAAPRTHLHVFTSSGAIHAQVHIDLLCGADSGLEVSTHFSVQSTPVGAGKCPRVCLDL